MTDETVQPSAPRDGEADDFAWRVHPALERPFAAITGVVVIVALGLAVHVFTGSKIWSLFATIVLCLSLHRFFFASSFRIDGDGVAARTLFGGRSLEWSEVGKVVYGGHGAWVSPLTSSKVREARRGILLLFGRRRDEVLSRLRGRLPAERIKHTGSGRPGQAK